MSKPKKLKVIPKETRVKAALQKERVVEIPTLPEPELFVNEKNGAGRPSMYSPYILPVVEKLAAQGCTNKEIYQTIGIGCKTFYEWIQRYPQFAHSIKKYNGLADIEVENALFKNAVGYKFTEVKRERRKDPSTGEYKLMVTEEVDKQMAGNAAAQIFYLKNRMAHRYKDKVETEISVAADISQVVFGIKRVGD